MRFGRVLQAQDVEYLQDVDSVLGEPKFEADIQQIPGRRSGISLRFFYMLTGSDDYIKPDRMIDRFLFAALGKNLTIQETHDAVLGAHKALVNDYPALTPKSLDRLIWNYQRSQ